MWANWRSTPDCVGGAFLPAPMTIGSKYKSGPRSGPARIATPTNSNRGRQECCSHRPGGGKRDHQRVCGSALWARCQASSDRAGDGAPTSPAGAGSRRDPSISSGQAAAPREITHTKRKRTNYSKHRHQLRYWPEMIDASSIL